MSRSVVLSVRNLSVAFGGVRAVEAVSFDLHEGATLGVIGPNGAGKSTLFDVIAGYLRPATGTVHLRGQDVTDLSVPDRVEAGLARGFQDAGLYPSLTVVETLAVAVSNRGPRQPLWATALGLRSSRTRESAILDEVDELIGQFGLGDYANKFVSELSTGTRRVVELAGVSAVKPTLLLLDEPSSGIAQREVEALGELLRATRERLGCALLIVEHDMPLVTGISDELLALDRGAVVTRGRPDEVVTHPHVVASYLGVDDDVIQRSGARS